ncbi:MAG: spore coat associated protein CotJA [Oscillospiraceae bacterium]
MYNNANLPNNNKGNELSAFPAETPIGMCYVPFQQWEIPYAENIALERGTIFPSLDLPFLGKEISDNERK